MEIDKISEEIHAVAIEKGFWQHAREIPRKMGEDSRFTDEEIAAVRKAFKAQRLMLVVSELSEALEADRKDKYTKGSVQMVNDQLVGNHFDVQFKGIIKDTFEDEMADAAIRIFDICEAYGIDLVEHIKAKVRFIKTREKMHGKKY